MSARGVGLCVCPYLIGNLLVLVIVSLILGALPFYFRYCLGAGEGDGEGQEPPRRPRR